ncbi:MAG: hypothetical protein R6U70_07060 [Bacillota bacterium]
MDLKQTTIHLPSILHFEVRRQADIRKMSMSEITRRALVRYLDLKSRDLLKAALHLEDGDREAAWSSIWNLVDTETTTAYQVLRDLIALNISEDQRAEITLSWLMTEGEKDILTGERATLVAAACLAELDSTSERLLHWIEEDLVAGANRERHRAVHLLDRTGRPPVSEMLTLLGECSSHSGREMLLGYLSHLCRRNTVGKLRQQLIEAVASGLSSESDDVTLRALDLAASLRAGELVEDLADISEQDGNLGHNALLALGAIAAKAPETGPETDAQFSLDSPLSYRRVDIDRPIPVPSWQQWSVREIVRERALAALLHRAETTLADNRSRTTAINGVARSRHPEGLRFLTDLALNLEGDGPISGHLLANALGQFDDQGAREALQALAASGPVATRRAALKTLHSRTPGPEEISAGPATELFTLASLLRVLTVRRVASPVYELDLNRHFSTLTPDHATARRWMVGLGLMDRESNEYTLTPMGETISAVERWLEDHGVRGARRVELLRGEVQAGQ